MSLENWHVALRPGKRRKLDVSNPIDAIVEEIKRLKASGRAKVWSSVSCDQAPSSAF